MPDLVAHYVASYLLAKQVLRDRLRALVIAIAGLAPDIDALLRMHRWVTHSVVMILPMLAVYAILKALGKERWAKLALIITALYALHLAMDIFTAPIPLLWPFSNTCLGIYLSLEGVITPSSLAIEPRILIEITVASFAPHVVKGPVLSLVGTTLLLTCLSIEVASVLRNKRG